MSRNIYCVAYNCKTKIKSDFLTISNEYNSQINVCVCTYNKILLDDYIAMDLQAGILIK